MDYRSFSLIPVDSVGHDVVEVFEGDETVVVEIGSFKHIFDFIVIDVFSNIFGDLFEFKAGEFTLRLMKKVRLC